MAEQIKHIFQNKSVTQQIGAGLSNDLEPKPDNNIEPITVPPVSSQSLHPKSLEHDQYAVEKLLKTVPDTFKSQAEELLQNIDSRPLELTFNQEGQIFIDSENLPGANIFLIFSQLFAKNKKGAPGLSEFATKLATMGLGHLFRKGILKSLKRPAQSTESYDHLQEDIKKLKHWWYIG